MTLNSASHALHDVARSLSHTSPLLRAGITLLGAAGLIDLVYHILEAAEVHLWVERLEHIVGHEAYPVHVLLVLSMMLIWLGVMVPGRRADN